MPRNALDPAELETWASLATLLEWLPAALDAQLQRDAGLTHFEYGVLYALAHADDRNGKPIGPLRVWPAGLTTARAIGFLGAGEAIDPMPSCSTMARWPPMSRARPAA